MARPTTVSAPRTATLVTEWPGGMPVVSLVEGILGPFFRRPRGPEQLRPGPSLCALLRSRRYFFATSSG